VTDLNALLAVFIVLLFPSLALAWVLATVRFAAELRRSEPARWREVAGPAWLNFRTGPLPALRFIQSARFRALPNRRLRSAGFLVRNLFAAVMLSFVAAAVVIVWSSLFR
jgi:hypothetical protein